MVFRLSPAEGLSVGLSVRTIAFTRCNISSPNMVKWEYTASVSDLWYCSRRMARTTNIKSIFHCLRQKCILRFCLYLNVFTFLRKGVEKASEKWENSPWLKFRDFVVRCIIIWIFYQTTVWDGMNISLINLP